jgi:hypothetical protein
MPAALALVVAACQPSVLREWPTPEKEYAWIPYVESISAPAEIFAYRSFDVTVKLSTQANPDLADDSRYQWMTSRRSPGIGHEGLYSIQIIRASKTGYAGDGYFDFEPGEQPNELRFSLRIDEPGEHTIRVLGASQQSAGGAAAAIFRGYEMVDYWYFVDETPAGTSYSQIEVDVLQPEFDDLYYYGYLPYVEEFVAPRQLYTDETVDVLVRLSTSSGGSGETQLYDLMDDMRRHFMLYFVGEPPPAGDYAGVLQFDGITPGQEYLSLRSAETREQGGLELAFYKFPESDGDWLKSGQSGYKYRNLEFEVLSRPMRLYGDLYEVRIPYVEDVVFPEHMLAGRPDEVAGAVSFLCSDDAAYITRQVLSVNGGMA